jgi:hypothetical protein
MATSKTAAKPTTPKTLSELRNYEGTLYVRNNSPYIQYNIRTELAGQKIDVELSPAGRPDSIAILPKAALELRGFQRAWLRGTITVSADPEIEDQITLLMNQHVKASEEQLAGFMGTVDTSNVVRELIEKPCLQCGKVNREGVVEGGRVVQSAADVKTGTPPLCEIHSNLAHMFVPEQQINANGETEWTFSPVTVK